MLLLAWMGGLGLLGAHGAGMAAGGLHSVDEPGPAPATNSFHRPKLFLFAGQSNMVGQGNRTNLPAADREPAPGVRMFVADPAHPPPLPLNAYRCWSPPAGYLTNYRAWGHTPDGAWNAGNPGHYDQVVCTFGPEFTTARDLASLLNETVYVAKYALGGSLLSGLYIPTWDPGAPDPAGNPAEYRLSLYHSMARWAVMALAAARAEAPDVEIAGFFWMQGESDVGQAAWANAYQTNFTNFIRRVREEFGTPELPFVFGRISKSQVLDSPNVVRAAQAAVDAADRGAAMVDTDDLPLNPADNIHYTSSGLKTLGQRFARAWLNIDRPPTVSNGSGASPVWSDTATLNGQLIATGGVPAQVTVFWGPADGGTNPDAWGNTAYLGIPRTPSFGLALTNLSTSTTYYYRCFAQNALGEAWALSTASFATLAPAADNDGDGMADVWETVHFGGISVRDGGPDDDWDSDGASNLAEYLAGTLPDSPASRLGIAIRRSGDGWVLNIDSVQALGPGYEGKTRYYDLESQPNLAAGAWQGVAGWTNLPADNRTWSYTNSSPDPARFFRLKARLE